MFSHTLHSLINRLLNAVPLLIAVIAALVVASFMLVALNADVGTAYTAMFQGAFGTENATAETLVKSIPRPVRGPNRKRRCPVCQKNSAEARITWRRSSPSTQRSSTMETEVVSMLLTKTCVFKVTK